MTFANDSSSIDYETLIQQSSNQLLSIPDLYDIFLSHASNSADAYPDELDFTKELHSILNNIHKKKTFLDIVDNPSYKYTAITAAANRSKFGVFICSKRYINIFYGLREEPYAQEYDIIRDEIDIFTDKERYLGSRKIPVKYGLTDQAFRLKNPCGQGFYIPIKDEAQLIYKEKALYVADQIVQRIKSVESVWIVTK